MEGGGKEGGGWVWKGVEGMLGGMEGGGGEGGGGDFKPSFIRWFSS